MGYFETRGHKDILALYFVQNLENDGPDISLGELKTLLVQDEAHLNPNVGHLVSI